ncbi:class I SAM-dependent methyltransferase [Pantoea sp. 18069]|uniref:class I SAM-dependent methyltransferase n=1 Tax=Pantoea sp. 18069 TaxID=2681415 RepID=UPI001356DF15|nr:SAM-dependent methyltransferase [Pantoea sp. 18069]
MTDSSESLAGVLSQQIRARIEAAGGWVGFDAFMALALYSPGLGYYANERPKFGSMPESGSDFVTAPEISPAFGRLLAAQVSEALERTDTREVWEFGAGTGALAEQLLGTLGDQVQRYTIVDLSGSLRARQQQRLAPFAAKLHWADALPDAMQGVVVGNEVLDAMPVQLLMRKKGQWFERGVVWDGAAGGFAWEDRPTALRPPLEIEGPQDYLTEIHAQGEAFVRTLAERLTRGAAFLIDYGFGEDEYYHPQRHMGTLVCHRAHRVDDNPLADLGLKDITAHVNFTGIAVAAQEAGMDVLGYTTQAHFLINCGLLQQLEQMPQGPRAMAAKLMMEHEMGELFKVIGLSRGVAPWPALGFVQGDRTHRL